LKRLHDARNLAIEIGKLVAAVDFPGGDRPSLAGACYHIALDHHEAVIRLVEAGVHVSALALVRAQVEAFVRGAWIHHIANDNEIEGVRNNKDFPYQWKMISALEAMDMFTGKVLSKSHTANWKHLHGLAHPGAGLIAMVLKDGHVERNCDEKFLIAALNYTGTHALFATCGIAMLADKGGVAERLLEMMKDWVEGS
jgi:hypothetical protein